MLDKHPTFPNPAIQEALCEIRFQMPDNRKWEAKFFWEFFKSIEKEFPSQEPAVKVGIRMQTDAESLEQTFLPPQQWMRYKHISRPLILQVTENILTINVLPEYPGWDIMRQYILDYWNRFSSVIEPEKIIRIGLRYVNRIERKTDNELPGIWLKASDYIPKAVLSSKPGFISHLDFYKDNTRIKVTLAEINKELSQGKKDIMFDIECIIQKKVKVNIDELILKEIDILHDVAWDIFSASLTPRLTRILKEKSICSEKY